MVNFQATGFPPAREDVERRFEYSRYQQMFEGDHKEAFAELSAKLPPGVQHKTYLICSFPELITNVSSDLLFGESPVFEIVGDAEGTKALGQWMKREKVHSKFLEGSRSSSFRGDVVYRLWPTGSGGQRRVELHEIPAFNYFPELDPDDVRNILSEAIAWIREQAFGRWAGERVLRVQHHLPGEVVEEAYHLSEDRDSDGLFTVGARIPLEQLYEPGQVPQGFTHALEGSLLFHIPNKRHGSRFWGRSDYSGGIDSLFDAVNNRFSRIDQYLDQHSGPKLLVPKGTLSNERSVNAEDLDVIELSETAAATGLPRYVTWEGQMNAAFREIDELTDKIFLFTETSPALFGLDKAGSIESSHALKMRMIRTSAMIHRKQVYWECGLVGPGHALMTAAYLLLTGEEATVSMIWGDSLPMDLAREIPLEVQVVAAGLSSKVSALQRLRGISFEEAAAELLRIEEERNLASLLIPEDEEVSEASEEPSSEEET